MVKHSEIEDLASLVKINIDILAHDLSETNIKRLKETFDIYRSLVTFEKTDLAKKQGIKKEDLDKIMASNMDKFKQFKNLKMNFTKVKLTEQPVDGIDLIKNTIKK